LERERGRLVGRRVQRKNGLLFTSWRHVGGQPTVVDVFRDDSEVICARYETSDEGRTNAKDRAATLEPIADDKPEVTTFDRVSCDGKRFCGDCYAFEFNGHRDHCVRRVRA
jgi:hypothetical protein